MDADEKMTELKKAYADMILNTAKEAAGRIMASERKAHRLEFELKESKDNALQMLTRLKEMMDSKLNEAEMASRTQQKKIEELEAQLQEAEDIVKDLREELSSMHAELERAKPQTAVNPDPIPTSDSIPASDKDRSNRGRILYNSLFPFRKSYIHDQDLPSIFLRSKGRKLFRSGCTHRIHACEGAPCEQTDAINPDLITETDEEGGKLRKDPSLGDERENDRKNETQVKETDHVDDNSLSSTARSIYFSNMEDSDESIDTFKYLISVSDVHQRLIEELDLLPMECEKTELPLASEAPVDGPESKTGETGGVPIRLTCGRIIKYTFQRKRKRGMSHLGNNMKKEEKDENALVETEKVMATEKSGEEETEKVKSREESTQEETHLEKVAKQLMALSAVKW